MRRVGLGLLVAAAVPLAGAGATASPGVLGPVTAAVQMPAVGPPAADRPAVPDGNPAVPPGGAAAPAPGGGAAGVAADLRVVVDVPFLGTLVITPAAGDATTALTVLTSDPCPAPSEAVRVVLSFPGVPPAPVTVLARTTQGHSTSTPVRVPLTATLAAAAAGSATPLRAGPHTVVLTCLDAVDAVTGAFVGTLAVDDEGRFGIPPTPIPPTSTPTPTTIPAAPPASTPSTAPATPAPSGGDGGGDGPGSSGPGGRLAWTGGPVAALLAAGLGLAAAGAALLLASRRRGAPSAPPQEGHPG